MRKLRRLPWRIPKSHNSQPSAPAQHEAAPRNEPEPPAMKEIVNSQPVAFAGGRYVYGIASSVTQSTEIRRKTRHRTLNSGLPVAG
jgi:hypothetical protein